MLHFSNNEKWKTIIFIQSFSFLQKTNITNSEQPILVSPLKIYPLNLVFPLPLHDPLPGPLCWPLLLMHPEVETTCIAHRVAQAVLPPGGGGGGEAVGTAQLWGDGEGYCW